MARADDDDLWEGDFQDVEFGVPRLRRGGDRATRPAGSDGHRWRWAVGGLAVGVTAAVALAVFGSGDDRSSAPTTAPTTTIGAPTVPELPPLSTTTVAVSEPPTTDVPPAPHTQLAVRTARAVNIVDAVTGEASGWAAPDLGGMTDVSMVAGQNWAVLVPAGGTGWFVRAGTDPVALDTGLMRPPGPVFPGPRPGTVWKYDESSGVLTLLGPAGEFVGQAVPGSDARPIGSDDLGTVVFQSADAAFLATEAGVAHLTDGQVVAIGPFTVVAVECNDRLGCFNVAIRREDGRPQMFGITALPVGGPLGRVSPSGSYVALVVTTDEGPSVRVVDTDTGLTVAERLATDATALVWSADGRALYYVGRDAQVHVLVLDALDTDQTLFIGSEPVLGLAPVGPADVTDS